MCESIHFLILNQGVLANKQEFEALQAKLEAIKSIVETYQKHDGLGALNHRIDRFCECVGSLSWFYVYVILNASRAITFQKNTVEKLHNNNLLTRAAQSTKDSDTILKAFRNVSSLCDIFQVGFLND